MPYREAPNGWTSTGDWQSHQGVYQLSTCGSYMAITVPKMLYVADLFLIPDSPVSKGTKGYISRLGRIQRQASLQITSAMRSTPTDVADACADLLPFHLLIRKLTYHATVRISMLPHAHPLVKHASRATTRYIRRRRAPLHKMLHAAHLKPADFEEISPCWRGPKWEPCFPICIPASRESAIQEASQLDAETMVFSDGSVIGGGVGAAAVLYRNGEERRSLKVHLGKESEHTIFEAELVDLVLAAELVRMEQHVFTVVLGVDSQV